MKTQPTREAIIPRSQRNTWTGIPTFLTKVILKGVPAITKRRQP